MNMIVECIGQSGGLLLQSIVYHCVKERFKIL